MMPADDQQNKLVGCAIYLFFEELQRIALATLQNQLKEIAWKFLRRSER